MELKGEPFMSAPAVLDINQRSAHRIASDEEALQLAQRLAADFAPDAARRDRERILPWAELESFSQSGLWGITVPREFGGAGVSHVTLAEVIATISSADGSLAQIPQNHYYALEVLRVGGSAAQKRFFYGLALDGVRFGNALAEIGHKDYQRRTRLTPEGKGYRVSGQKFYCTGALYAQWIPTLVVDDNQDSYLAFIPRHSDGVEITDDWDGFGQRVTGSGSVSFKQVWVEPEWIVPFKASFDRPTSIGPFAQLLHCAIDSGQARGAYQETLHYVREHARPWIDAGVDKASRDPLLLERVGNVQVRLRAADALLHRAGRVLDALQQQAFPDARSVAEASVAVAEAKVLTTEVALLAANQLFELSGTSATLGERNLDRYWRNARVHTLHDPVRWKFFAVGNYVLNDVLPPRHGAL
ncbi:SfnB family sulfur acquisition oxidoreductase [Aquitalea palustris]|uniref:SfnB family sulfur acquisition oxidoreductase n=2 Tax=Aquitalea palustris TaxID=2480983 RepID=A0A454JMK2_9NEIS|nr:SfnB family sulfur acquisition oxidoreductase [Aquitalea palustris]